MTVLCALTTGAAPDAGAASSSGRPIVYMETATASGTLDGHAFTNASVTLRHYANTADAMDPGTGYPQNRVGTVIVTVAGIGHDTVTYGTSFVNQGVPGNIPAAYGINGANSSEFGVLNSTFSNYNLSTAFGPVTGPAQFNPHRGMTTTHGGFITKSVGTVTFRAYFPAG